MALDSGGDPDRLHRSRYRIADLRDEQRSSGLGTVNWVLWPFLIVLAALLGYMWLYLREAHRQGHHLARINVRDCGGWRCPMIATTAEAAPAILMVVGLEGCTDHLEAIVVRFGRPIEGILVIIELLSVFRRKRKIRHSVAVGPRALDREPLAVIQGGVYPRLSMGASSPIRIVATGCQSHWRSGPCWLTRLMALISTWRDGSS